MLENISCRILIIYAVTLVCMGIFVLRYKHIRKRDTIDAKNVFWILVLIVAGMFVDWIGWTNDMIWSFAVEDELIPVTAILGSLCFLAREALFLQIIVFWNRFVDYAVYRSLDHVKKKYRRAILPALSISCIFIAVHLIQSRHYREFASPINICMDLMGFLCYVLQFYYLANAIWIAWKSTKERKAPTFLRVDRFIIPMIIGFLLNYLVVLVPDDIFKRYYSLFEWFGFDTRFPFLLISAILTWQTVEKRYRYMDPANGFYNKEFLSDMNDYMEKSGYPNGVGVYFRSPGSKGKLIPVLNQLKPADAEIFSLGEDEYLLMAGPQKESVLRLLIKSVELGLAEEDKTLEVKSAYAVREQEESTEDFTKQLLELQT